MKTFDAEMGGLPVGYYLLYLVGHIPYTLFVFKILTFASISLSGCLIFYMCNRITILSEKDSLLIALIFIGYPSFQLSFMLSTSTYWIWYFIFLLACFFAIQSTLASGILKFSLVLISLILFSISFRVGSLLVIYFGFLFYFFNMKFGEVQKISINSLLDNIFFKSYYVIFPFVYFFSIKKFFPSSGVYATYNKINIIDLEGILNAFLYFIKNSIIDQVTRSIFFASTIWFIFIFVAIFSFAIAKFIYSRRDYYESIRSVYLPLLLFGLYLLFLSIFPYAVVLKYPHDTGVETRHSILIGLPMALILISFIKSISKRSYILKDFFLISMIISFSLISINNYFTWQAHWIKDKSTIQHLKILDPKDYSIFWIKDDVVIKDTEPWHQYYAYSGMFRYAWGGSSRIGLDIRDKNFYQKWIINEGRKYFQIKRYNLFNLNVYGKQALLSISEGVYPKKLGRIKMDLMYWYYKYFNPKKIKNFLLKLTTVTIKTI